MEQGYSLFNAGGSLNFDFQNIECAGDEEEKEALEEARQKEEELQNALATAFDDLIDDDDDDCDDDQDSHSSEEQSQVADEEADEGNGNSGFRTDETSGGPLSSYRNSSSGNCNEHSSNHIQNGDCDVGAKNSSQVSFTGCEFTVSDKSYAAAAEAIGRRYEDILTMNHIPDQEISADDSIYPATHPSASSASRNYEYNLNGDVQSGYTQEESELQNNVENNGYGMHDAKFLGDDYNVSENCNPDNQASNEEMMKLQVLYNARGKELQRLKKELENVQSAASSEINILKHQLTLMEGEKDGLLFSLQQSQNLVSDKSQTCSTLEGKLNAVEFQLSAERQAKEEIMRMLEGTETTLRSLEQQVAELSRSENLARAREQHEGVVSNLKQCHQQEVLELKQEVDSYKRQLDLKVEEVQSLHHQMKQFEQRCQQLQIDKAETVNRLTSSLEASQHQLQELLESGTVSEVSKVRMQLQHVTEEKSEIEKKNKELMEEVELLASEVKSFETARHLGFQLSDDSIDDSVVQLGLRRKKSKNKGKLIDDITLHKEWERALSTLRSQRAMITSLKDRLQVTRKELVKQSEKAKEFERTAEAAQKQADELLEKVNELCPAGSVPLAHFQKEIDVLETDKAKLIQELQEVQHRLQEVSESEEKLNEINRQLREEMSAMVRQNDEDKHLALQRCRESCRQLQEDAVSRLKQELTSQAESEMQKLQFDYENEITLLRKEISFLNNNLHDVKTQYIDMCQNTKHLQENFQDLDQEKMKLRKEIGAKFEEEFQKELEKIQVELEKQKKEFFENKIQEEVNKAEKQWAQKKVKDVENFITEVKNQLDKEFQDCLEKEKDKILSLAKEEYQVKISFLKKQWEKEKIKLLEDWKEKLTAQWNKEKSDLIKEHELEVQKIIAEQNAKHANAEKLENELLEKMKSSLLETEKDLKEKLNVATETENRLRERLQKYRKHIDKITEKHTEEIEKLKSKMLEQLTDAEIQKGSELKAVKDKYVLQLLTTEKRYKEIINQRKEAKSSSYCQTDEVLIPKLQVLHMYEIVLCSLKKIQEDFMNYLVDSRKRATERLQLALVEYHRQFIKNLFEDGSTNSSVDTANNHCHQGAKGTGLNSTLKKKNKHQIVQHCTALTSLTSTTLPKSDDLRSSSSEGSGHVVRTLNDHTGPNTHSANGNFDNALAAGDGCHPTADMLEPLDVSRELLDLPQQKSAFNLLTQTLKSSKYDFSTSHVNGDLQEVIKSYFPERLCPERHNLS